MRVLPYGESALLLDLDDPAAVPAVRAALAGRDDVVDAVAGAATVLAVARAGRLEAVRAAAGTVLAEAAASEPSDSGPLVVLPVRYDGPDLDVVAGLTGLSREQVMERHARGAYRVRFCGFAPGFAYLDGLDPRLHVPRRAEPRRRVPAGAVGLAGEFTGVYPRASPGGWQLIGTTDVPLWDLHRTPPALLPPGTRVRFEPT
jgi:KipI family sensor histidine kinase inhibitor